MNFRPRIIYHFISSARDLATTPAGGVGVRREKASGLHQTLESAHDALDSADGRRPDTQATKSSGRPFTVNSSTSHATGATGVTEDTGVTLVVDGMITKDMETDAALSYKKSFQRDDARRALDVERRRRKICGVDAGVSRDVRRQKDEQFLSDFGFAIDKGKTYQDAPETDLQEMVQGEREMNEIKENLITYSKASFAKKGDIFDSSATVDKSLTDVMKNRNFLMQGVSNKLRTAVNKLQSLQSTLHSGRILASTLFSLIIRNL